VRRAVVVVGLNAAVAGLRRAGGVLPRTATKHDQCPTLFVERSHRRCHATAFA